MRGELEDIVAGCRYGLHGVFNEHFAIAVVELVRAGCIVFLPNCGGQVEIAGGEPALMFTDDAAKQSGLREWLAVRCWLYNENRYMNELRADVRHFVAKQGT